MPDGFADRLTTGARVRVRLGECHAALHGTQEDGVTGTLIGPGPFDGQPNKEHEYLVLFDEILPVVGRRWYYAASELVPIEDGIRPDDDSAGHNIRVMDALLDRMRSHGARI